MSHWVPSHFPLSTGGRLKSSVHEMQRQEARDRASWQAFSPSECELRDRDPRARRSGRHVAVLWADVGWIHCAVMSMLQPGGASLIYKMPRTPALAASSRVVAANYVDSFRRQTGPCRHLNCATPLAGKL
jgi:hypothetical protein